jgi:glycosyltransferase involved in cell wall biosynthesis
MISWLTAKGLADLGHQVLLVAPKGSKVPANVELHETTIRESEQQAYSGYWQRLLDYDCIVDHSWQKWSYILKMEGHLKAPILGVLHAPVHTMYNSPPPVPFPCLVAISHDQSKAVQEHLKCNSRVAYNGCDTDFYRPSSIKIGCHKAMTLRRNVRYLFLARISSIKGPHIAVDVARACKVGLDVVGDDTMTGEPELAARIKEQCALSPTLRYIGPQDRNQCVEWFNKNYALLHPNETFREPFGLAPVEAQLCGMPVIAWDNGAMRETIKDKETGFLVKSQKEIEELIKSDAVGSITPERCREWASQFSQTNMIARYEDLCKEAVEGGGW